MVGFRFVVVLAAAVSLLGCKFSSGRAPAAPGKPFADDFNRTTLGTDWNDTGGGYELRDGKLRIQGAHNKPLWLKHPIPRDARIEFDVRSDSPEGDIKVEVYGDGVSRAETTEYTATSYVVIFGGWHNQLNVLARMEEHGHDRAVGPKFPVQIGHTYHMRIERKGGTITAWADDHELATMSDSAPLEGKGHEHFGFNNWQSDLTFDNLKITPL